MRLQILNKRVYRILELTMWRVGNVVLRYTPESFVGTDCDVVSELPSDSDLEFMSREQRRDL